MADTTITKIKFPTEQDVERARQELYSLLAEAEKCPDKECIPFEVAMREIREKHFDKV